MFFFGAVGLCCKVFKSPQGYDRHLAQPTILQAKVARPLVNSDGTFKLPRLEVWWVQQKRWVKMV